MTHFIAAALQRPRLALASAVLLACLAVPQALAAPGAHGPDGEHLDETSAAGSASARPRVEAASDLFELVAEVRGGALNILVDRFETNEPVLGAKLDVASGALMAVADFRVDSGDYAVTDAALLKALAAPGEHALVFTLVAGDTADLLDGTLVNPGGAAVADGHGHRHGAAGDDHGHALERAAWIGAGVLALGVLGGTAWWRQRRRAGPVAPKGVLS